MSVNILYDAGAIPALIFGFEQFVQTLQPSSGLRALVYIVFFTLFFLHWTLVEQFCLINDPQTL